MANKEMVQMKKFVLGTRKIMATAPDNFAQELSQTPVIGKKLSANLKRLKKDIKSIIKTLNYSKEAADKLTQLNDDLNTMSTTLAFVAIIPQIRTPALQLRRSVDALNSKVKPAKNKAVAIEAKIKPIREALVNIDKKLDAAIKAVDNLVVFSTSFLRNFNKIRKCINSLPDGPPKEYGQKFIVEFSMAYEPSVAEMNAGLTHANTIIEAFYNQVSALKKKLDILSPMINGINAIMKALKPIMGPLDQLVDMLKFKIKIPPIPIPYIPTMNVSLYDILDKFKEFSDLAMKLLDPILKLIPTFKIPLPAIPYISNLINFNLDIIPKLPNFSNLFANIEMWLPKIKIEFKRFTLTCPPNTKKISFLAGLQNDLADVHQYIHDGSYFGIKASNGKFLTIDTSELVAKSSTLDNASKFQIRLTVDKKLSIMTKSGLFLKVHPDGCIELVKSLPESDYFMKVVPNNAKTFSILGPRKKYLSATPKLQGGYVKKTKQCTFSAILVV